MDKNTSRRPPAQPTLGSRIASLRQQSGMTQAALAKALGILRVTVAFWETDRYTVPSHELPRIATALGVPAEVFLNGMASMNLQRTVTMDEAALLDLYRAGSVMERIRLLQIASRLNQAAAAGRPSRFSRRPKTRAASGKCKQPE